MLRKAPAGPPGLPRLGGWSPGAGSPEFGVGARAAEEQEARLWLTLCSCVSGSVTGGPWLTLLTTRTGACSCEGSALPVPGSPGGHGLPSSRGPSAAPGLALRWQALARVPYGAGPGPQACVQRAGRPRLPPGPPGNSTAPPRDPPADTAALSGHQLAPPFSQRSPRKPGPHPGLSGGSRVKEGRRALLRWAETRVWRGPRPDLGGPEKRAQSCDGGRFPQGAPGRADPGRLQGQAVPRLAHHGCCDQEPATACPRCPQGVPQHMTLHSPPQRHFPPLHARGRPSCLTCPRGLGRTGVSRGLGRPPASLPGGATWPKVPTELAASTTRSLNAV